MQQVVFRLLFFTFVFCLSSALPDSAGAIEGTVKRQLVIGTKHVPPFAFKNDTGQWEGISIELWKRIADDMNLEYQFEEQSLEDLLKGLENTFLDAAVAALTVTQIRSRVKGPQDLYKVTVGSIFEKQQYGIGLPSSSIHRERINQLIPEIINSDEWQSLLFTYLGNTDPS